MFLVASGMANITAFFICLLLMYFKLRSVTMAGGVLLLLGCGLFAYSTDSFVAYLPGFVAIAMGGSFVQMTVLHTANSFQQHRGKLMSLLLSGTDVSAYVFLAFQLVHHSTGASLKTMFLVLAAVPCLFVVFGALVQTKDPIFVPGNDPLETFLVRKQPFRTQLQSLEFFFLLLWVTVGSASTYFFIATLADQLHHSTSKNYTQMRVDERVEWVTYAQKVFSFLLPIAGSLGGPLFGFILDSLGSALGLGLCGLGLFLYQLLLVVPDLPLPWVYVTFTVFIITRAVMFSLYAHLTNLMFGANFIKVLGVLLPCSGMAVFVNVLWTKTVDDTLEHDYFSMNLAFLALNSLSSLLLLGVVKHRILVETEDQPLLDASDMRESIGDIQRD